MLRPALTSSRPATGRHYRIQPSRGLAVIDLREVWQRRELLYYLVWRDIKARYKQTVLGGLWAIIRPLVSMVILAAIFGGLAGISSGSKVPYPLFLYAGLLPWTYFQSAFSLGATSLLNSSALIGKAYFPRVYAPLAALIAPLVDFSLSLIVLFGLFAWFGWAPSWHFVAMPLFVLLAFATALGIALWTSGISVRYRDFGFALPFVAQVWMYVTPVIYPVSLVPDRFHWVLGLNPLAAVIEGFRWSLLGTPMEDSTMIWVAVIIVVVLVGGGLVVFRRVERTIVDMA